MKRATTRLAEPLKIDRLSSWENEGGAIGSRRSRVQHDETPFVETFDAYGSMADTNTLTMLRASLLLVVPVLGIMVASWIAIAARTPL